jgi:hypothetical protein
MSAEPSVTIPDRLVSLVRGDETRRVKQPVIEFAPDRWIERAPDYAEVIADLPAQLDRTSVHEFCDRQPLDDSGALGIFIASQIWGYGQVGYGPFRLGEALAAPALAPTLSAGRALLGEGRPVDAFRELCVRHELPWVGTAFGTKFLHFADPTGRALILDSVVAGWLKEHTGLNFRCLRSEQEYATWLELAAAWAESTGTTSERIELLVFSDGLPEGSQWLAES